MKKSRILSLFLTAVLLTGILSPTAAAVGDPPAVKSASVYLVDQDTGYVYFSQNADVKVYPASLTKIMTALIVIEAIQNGEATMDDMVTAPEGFAFDLEEGGSTASIVAGETMSLRDLLYCTMVVSANEACNIMAMYLCGSTSAFVERMNQKARELGCTGTHFVNVHGLPNEDHYTTAQDMYRIAAAAMQYEDFVTICDTARYTVQATNRSKVRDLTNTNGLISSDSVYKGFYYEPAIGIKTGYTTAAGYCLVSSAKKDGISLLCVVMGGRMEETATGFTDYSNYTDSTHLYDWVFNNYTRQEVITATDLLTEIPVRLGSDADTVALRAQAPISAVLPNDLDLGALERTVTIYDEQGGCQAPINEGDVLGSITLSLDGVVYGTANLVANRSVDLSYLQSMGSTIAGTLKNTWVRVVLGVVLGVGILYAVLVIRYRMRYRQRLREQQEAKLQRQRMREQAQRDRMFAQARRQEYRAEHPGEPPRKSDVTRDYFEDFFRDDD